jgi:hypothetical protein
MAVSGTGLSGSASFTANQAGASSFTVTSNATNLNTASAIVARDASGNFSAGTITAALSGNASTATSATTAGSITSQANSATITAATANTASTIVLRDASGNFSAGTISAALTGNVTGNVSGSSGSTTGNAATVTNGFYTTSSFNLGTTSIAVNRASATQSLTGVNIDGSAGSATTATTATNVAGGAANQVHVQTGVGTTGFISNGTAGQVLTANASGAPTFQTATSSGASKSYVQAMGILRGL